MGKLYVYPIHRHVIHFGVLAFIMASTASSGGSNGAFMGFLIWSASSATDAVGRLLWERKNHSSCFDQCVATVLNLWIGGAIIGALR